MLALLGLAMVVVFTVLIMTKRLSPIVALTVVPIVFAVIGGFGGTTGKMMLDGLKMVAPSAALLLFGVFFVKIVLWFCIVFIGNFVFFFVLRYNQLRLSSILARMGG